VQRENVAKCAKKNKPALVLVSIPVKVVTQMPLLYIFVTP
jgi:hypothetical protein